MTSIAPPVKQRLNREQAAEYLGLSVATLAADVVTQRHRIPFHKLGRRVVYSLVDLDRWLAARAVNAPTESI